MSQKILQRINDNSVLFENKLKEYLDITHGDFPGLFEAMRYSVLDGGKRVRPFLVLEFCRLFGGNRDIALNFGCALEMIHSYSLVHDDLPCMDNDELRRGKPTTHIKYGYANALLCGDGLLTYAFEVLSRSCADPAQICDALSCLSHYAGVFGMIGGQQIDLDSENKQISIEKLKLLHSLKTGALIKCACELGCISAGIKKGDKRRDDALEYASEIGVTFQIIDDILDVTGDAELFGKPIGSDAENGKTTFLTFMSVDEAYSYASKLTEQAVQTVKKYPDNEILCEFAKYLLDRKK